MRRKILLGIVSSLFICLATQLICADNPSTKDATAVPESQVIQSEDIGEYLVTGVAPDILTTSGSNIEVTDGSAFPENPFDFGKISLIGKSGGIATFSGRSLDWGCIYNVSGVYTGGSGTGPNRWDSKFKDENEPRLRLEINGSGDDDNYILMTANGAKLFIDAFDVPDGINSITVTITKTSNPGNALLSSSTVTLTSPMFTAMVSLQGTQAGDVTFTATATNFESDDIDGTVSEIVLEQITFSVPSGSSAIYPIKKDDNSGFYPTPHWARDYSDQSPVCYKQSSVMQAQVGFLAPGLEDGTEITIRGNWIGIIYFGGEDGITATVQDERIDVTVSADISLPNSIAYIPNFNIVWEYQPDGGNFAKAGESENPLYVLLDTPGSTPYYTVVHLSCKNAAGKTTIDQATVNAIYSELTDKRVYNVKGQLLKYWANTTNQQASTPGLLTVGNGTCAAWSDFMYDLVKVQTSSAAIKGVAFYPKPHIDDSSYVLQAAGIYVKNGTYIDNQHAPNMSGSIPGQGGIPCGQFFDGHALNKFGTTYYDPSYGTPICQSRLSWQQASLVGTVEAYTVNENIRLFYYNAQTTPSEEIIQEMTIRN